MTDFIPMQRHGQLYLANPTDSVWTTQRYLFSFGAYGSTRVLAWGNYLGEALDAAVDALQDAGMDGIFCDEQVAEAYKEAMAEGLEEDEAHDRALNDVTTAGNNGRHILSWEWNVLENPSREIIARAKDRV